jgi:REP element-mobilizing transposase RayT
MPRRIRFIPEGSLVEVTSRTIQGRFLLTPSPEVRLLTLGVLARANRLYPLEIHAFAFLSNHYHLLVTVASAERLARFINYLNSNLAREMGRVVHWREKFWGRRYQAVVVSTEEAAQVERLRYVLSHGCKENLVARPEDWPGAHCAAALRHGTKLVGKWVNRTLESRTARGRSRVSHDSFVDLEELTLSPLPCWRHLSASECATRVDSLLATIELERSRRNKELGCAPFGARRIARQDPFERPNRRPRRPLPLVHAISRSARRRFRSAYRDFVAAYRRAAAKLREGRLDTDFPFGSFPPSLPFARFKPG